MKHYSANVKKGEEIIEFHVQELAQEGITYVAPFEDVPLAANKAASKKNGVMNGGAETTAAATVTSRAANGSQRVSHSDKCANSLEAEAEVGGASGGQAVLVSGYTPAS